MEQLPREYRIQISESAYEVVEEPMTQSNED